MTQLQKSWEFHEITRNALDCETVNNTSKHSYAVLLSTSKLHSPQDPMAWTWTKRFSTSTGPRISIIRPKRKILSPINFTKYRDLFKLHLYLGISCTLSCIATNNQGQTIKVSKHRHRSCGYLSHLSSLKKAKCHFSYLLFHWNLHHDFNLKCSFDRIFQEYHFETRYEVNLLKQTS